MHAREPASFSLARKCESHHHSTTGFCENVVVVETSDELLEILSFCYPERASPPLIKKNSVITFPGCICFENARKDFQVKSRPRI